MKYLKLFESYTESDVAEICKKYAIENWSINSEGLVDVNGDVFLTQNSLTKLPINFGFVSGDFSCRDNQLTTLEGCPQVVDGSFFCTYNQLTTLEGCPQVVGGDFNCLKNLLTSLEFSPLSIGGYFNCSRNKLTSLRFAPEYIECEVFVLPNPIEDIPGEYLTKEYIQFIVKEQYDWNLYRKDGTIYLERLEQMIEWGIETNKIKPL